MRLKKNKSDLLEKTHHTMGLRRTTGRLAFSVIVTIIASNVIVGCNSDEYEGMAPRKTFATRSANDSREPNPSGMDYGNPRTLYIPEGLLGSTGCGYKSIHNAFGGKYSVDTIKYIMNEMDSDVEHFPIGKIKDVIHRLTNVNPTITDNGSVSVGDIVYLTSQTISEYAGLASRTGHITVVNELTNKESYTEARSYDSCIFSVSVVTRVFKTSEIK